MLSFLIYEYLFWLKSGGLKPSQPPLLRRPCCLLVGFRESCELLHLRGVLNFFLYFRSELATEVVLHGTIRLDSKIRFQKCSLS